MANSSIIEMLKTNNAISSASVANANALSVMEELENLKDNLDSLKFELRDTMDIGDLQLTASIVEEIDEVEKRITDACMELDYT